MRPIVGTSSPDLRETRIIVGALIAGAVSITVALGALAAGRASSGGGDLTVVLAAVWVALGIGEMVAWPLIRRPLAREAAAAASAGGGPDAAKQQYTTATVIAAAMAEGASLFAAVSGFVTGRLWLLLLALPGLAVLVLIFPSEQKLRRFLAIGGEGAATTSPR